MSGHRPNSNFGANRIVADHRLYIDDNGIDIGYEQEMVEYLASTAVTEGQLVSLVAATLTAPEKVTVNTTGQNMRLCVGVALHTVAAGDVLRVCKSGICHVLVEAAATPARGDLVINGGTLAGSAGTTAAPDATTVIGTGMGAYLTAKLTSYLGSANYAIARIYKV